MGYLTTFRGSGAIPKTIATAVFPKRSKRNTEDVKAVIDQIKGMLRQEKDPTVRKYLAKAGLSLNNILIR